MPTYMYLPTSSTYSPPTYCTYDDRTHGYRIYGNRAHGDDTYRVWICCIRVG